MMKAILERLGGFRAKVLTALVVALMLAAAGLSAHAAEDAGAEKPQEGPKITITIGIGTDNTQTVSGNCPCNPCPCVACCRCCPLQTACGQDCACTDAEQTKITIPYITDEFLIHREWLVKIVWEAHMLPAMMLMTEQLTAAAMQHITMIGMLYDAKHQLESQALFQELHAEAHKDYQVSEGVCMFGTNTRSLAIADQNSQLSHIVIGNRMLQRQLISADVLSSGSGSDLESRLEQFMSVYCDPNDNAKGFSKLCGAGGDKKRRNKDVDFATTIDRADTLEIDFTPQGDAKHTDRGASADEEDIFALAANMYGHTLPFPLPEIFIADNDGNQKEAGAFAIMDLRSLAAKRSVAQNSFAAIAGMRTKGGEEVKPYMEALLKEIGIPDKDIEEMLSDKPSYYAQMDILTKKIYQDPNFYTNLYDKPANVARKNVAMRAIGNMQKRDIYRSMLRSEATMAVWLEMELMKIQEPLASEIERMDQEGTVRPIP